MGDKSPVPVVVPLHRRRVIRRPRVMNVQRIRVAVRVVVIQYCAAYRAESEDPFMQLRNGRHPHVRTETKGEPRKTPSRQQKRPSRLSGGGDNLTWPFCRDWLAISGSKAQNCLLRLLELSRRRNVVFDFRYVVLNDIEDCLINIRIKPLIAMWNFQKDIKKIV